jgi:hypothetical protein
MLAALALKQAGADDREIWLYDTFEGMTEPGELDIRYDGKPACERWREFRQAGRGWCLAGLEEVMANMAATGYPPERLRFVKGRVEETVHREAPERIALLRLDTDWYRSTQAEMEALFPRLSRGGVLMLDDYGHWGGARRAVDEYLRSNGVRMLLSRIDYTGRVGVKT